jgi:L-ascorbate metabolism protein UlaG (beta-lactamase superfamily)
MEYVKWLGHASFIVKAKGKTIYIDPYEGEYTEKADFILVTHSHHDHCGTSKIAKILRDGTTVFAPADCISKIEGNVRSLKPGEEAVVGSITVEAVEAYNYKRFRSPGVPYHPKGLGVGYLITVEDKTIYHAGDTDFIPEMKQLNLRNIDLALLPSGGTYTMDNPEAAEATLAIKPKAVIPMHRWDTDPEEFRKNVEAKSHINVVTLKPGEQFTFQ